MRRSTVVFPPTPQGPQDVVIDIWYSLEEMTVSCVSARKAHRFLGLKIQLQNQPFSPLELQEGQEEPWRPGVLSVGGQGQDSFPSEEALSTPGKAAPARPFTCPAPIFPLPSGSSKAATQPSLPFPPLSKAEESCTKLPSFHQLHQKGHI